MNSSYQILTKLQQKSADILALAALSDMTNNQHSPLWWERWLKLENAIIRARWLWLQQESRELDGLSNLIDCYNDYLTRR